jgi:hypothetical protein
MFEVILLCLSMLLIAGCAFLPMDCSALFSHKDPQHSDAASDFGLNSKWIALRNSTIKPHFFANLHSGIGSALFSRPTDSVLQRHYDTLVSAELEAVWRQCQIHNNDKSSAHIG